MRTKTLILLTAIAVLFFLLAPVLLGGEIVARAADGPPVRPLPRCVQALDAASYADWAEWQNSLARKASAAAATGTPYLRGYQTITESSGDMFSRGISQSYDRAGLGQRTAGSGTSLYGSYRGGSVSTTLPTRVRNPGYQRPSTGLYNPFCKPTGGKGRPDWDRLYCVHEGRVLSIRALADLVPHPVDMEKFYSAYVFGI